jgi:hypothetical protein
LVPPPPAPGMPVSPFRARLVRLVAAVALAVACVPPLVAAAAPEFPIPVAQVASPAPPPAPTDAPGAPNQGTTGVNASPGPIVPSPSPPGLGSVTTFPQRYIGSVDIPHTDVAPANDGTLNDPLWQKGALVTLSYDLRKHAAADQQTTARLLTDGKFLYVGIEAKSSIPVRATEHTNGVGLDTDDEVQVDLWPNGTSGFMYKFTSTSIGTHYQYSTENNLFEPTWQSVGHIHDGGFTITEAVPLASMHGTGSRGWRAQFIRYMPVTNQAFVWSYGPAMQSFNDVNFSGDVSGLPKLQGFRPKPRAGIYALGALAAPSAGGSTSRMGADVSVPLVPGTAFVGTFHPDFSNVEVDQQTISPTAFARIFTEVRPFFSQGNNFYSYPQGQCVGCPGIVEFYSPNIPTPRDGYAVEGQNGLFSYATLDALGVGRTDTAQAVNYVSPNQQNEFDTQRSSVSEGNFYDEARGFTFVHDNHTNLFECVRYADDRGTNVLDAARAQRYEACASWYTPTSSLNAVVRKVGQYFDPVDGIVQHPDIAGYNVNFSKQFKYSQTSAITEVDVSGTVDRYQGHLVGLDQSDTLGTITAFTKSLFSVSYTGGSSYVLLAPNLLSPVSQPGLTLSYNTQSAMPTSVTFASGRFGPGQLVSWFRNSTVKAGPRGLFTLEVDDTDQFTDTGARYTQWLERASFALQSGPDTSLALGVRRIIGAQPALVTPFPYVNAWNLSAAFHRKLSHGEVYFAYGDASAFATVPEFILKYIHYVGAEKGT